jgi:hypothetical protein
MNKTIEMPVAIGLFEWKDLLSEVETAAPADRAQKYANLCTVLVPAFMHDDKGDGATAAQRNASTYLRALSTYPAASDAWLDVFRAFRKMLEAHFLPAAIRTGATSGAKTLRFKQKAF